MNFDTYLFLRNWPCTSITDFMSRSVELQVYNCMQISEGIFNMYDHYLCCCLFFFFFLLLRLQFSTYFYNIEITLDIETKYVFWQ